AYLLAGVDLLKLNQPARAVPFLLRASKLKPKDREVSLHLGQAFAATGDFTQGNTWYAAAAAIDARSADAWYGLGLTYLKIAQQSAEALARGGAGSPYAQALLAEALVEQGKMRNSIRLYQAILESHAGPPCMRTALGFAELRSGRAADAEREFRAELESSPRCLGAHFGLARIFDQKGDTAGAEREAEAAWETDPGFAASYAPAEEIRERLDRGRAQRSAAPVPQGNPRMLASAGRYTACAASLGSRSTVLAPADRQLLAECAFHSGRFRASFEAAGKLLAPGPLQHAGLYWRARSSQRLALESLARAGEIDPDSHKLHLLLGDALRQQNKLKEAQAEYRRAIELKPDGVAGHLGLARTLFVGIAFDEAVVELNKALSLVPGEPEASALMGYILVYKHQFEEARPYLKAALRGAPAELPHVHAALGKVYASEDRTGEAIAELRQALPADDDGSYHARFYQLCRKAGDTAGAASALREWKLIRQRRAEQARVEPETE
ncbi:MAG TPA: tetratricopeptide repeat protein, partial [Bryobacteraceae bacterium]|nr:tetratricopeptide repeat protein [Bryobacteraceae bacterium]